MTEFLHTLSYVILPLMLAVVLHEYAHGWVAHYFGDDPLDVAFLSAQLAFYDVKVSLLGSNSWNSPELLRWGKSTTEEIQRQIQENR